MSNSTSSAARIRVDVLSLLENLHSVSKPSLPVVVQDLRLRTSGHVRVLALNRPRDNNALSSELIASLKAEIARVKAQYSAEGDEMTSSMEGADLKEREKFTTAETNQFLNEINLVFDNIANLPIPTISAIPSLALGGGLELALATTFRVLTENAILGLPETRLSVIPGAGGFHRLPLLVGLAKARDIILTGRRINAQEAYTIGLADRLAALPKSSGYDDKTNGLLAEAKGVVLLNAYGLAEQICEGGPVAIRAAVHALNEHNRPSTLKWYQKVINTLDRKEGILAFIEKRQPTYHGL